MSSLHTRLQAYLNKHRSTTKLLIHERPTFKANPDLSVKDVGIESALTARPQTTEDVQVLVHYSIENNVRFVVRTGSHDYSSNIQGVDIMWIDMRDIDYVDVAGDRTTAKVGGGIFFRGLSEALKEQGLVTLADTIANIGYAGWETIASYGHFSALHGLGADQIVSAKFVNAQGDIDEASDEELHAIIRRGGIFGVIVELTLKVCSLKEVSRVARSRYKSSPAVQAPRSRLLSNYTV
ncbi:hypothetical protein F4777DRAFT_596065 [Nemania sp. FL0916]|nr:hypothetical protein F4777DRAFT_596065 [Nemania sp. FL0916]